MKIVIVGAGYVGLVTGVCFADLGHEIICVDKDKSKIGEMKKGVPPIFEPGLEQLMQKNIQAQRLFFSENIKEAVLQSNIIFIAVDTPSLENGEADIKNIKIVAETIAEIKRGSSQYFIVVNKSTVPVGTAQIVKNIFLSKGFNTEQFGVVSNPEFLREGSAINDSMRPDRIIIGGDNQKAIDIIAELYTPLYRIEMPIIKTNLETAELIKYAANSFLATKIAFINEMANICDAIGADIHLVAKGIGSDGRIGKYFLHPGPGFGGACFPKDSRALVKIAEKAGFETKIVKAVIEANKFQKSVILQKIHKHFENNLDGKTFALLGLSFKANTDDIRETPALLVVNELLKKGAKIKAFDPVAMPNFKKVISDKINYADNIYSAIEDADALILLTEWNDFRYIDIEKVKELLKKPIIFDARNLYDPKKLKESGFIYYSIGRDNC